MASSEMPVLEDFPSYLAKIEQFPLLSVEEERILVKKKDKDRAASETLVTSNLRFVVKVALEYKLYGMGVMDLIQEGNLGLMVAVKKFDPSKETRLITYAVWWIRSYIHEFLMKNWSMLKIGVTNVQRNLFFKLNQVRQRIKNLTGEDNFAAVADALNVKESEVRDMAERMQQVQSLHQKVFSDAPSTQLEVLPDPRSLQEEALAEKQVKSLVSRTVAEAMKRLTERERFILENRVLAENPMPMQEAADHFEISREWMRRTEASAIEKMKKWVAVAAREGGFTYDLEASLNVRLKAA